MILAPTPVPDNTRALVLQSACPLIENESVPLKASFRHTEGQKMVEGPGVLCPPREVPLFLKEQVLLDFHFFCS